MIDFSNFTNIGNGIYQQKNFLSEEEIKFLLGCAKKIDNWDKNMSNDCITHYSHFCEDVVIVYNKLKPIVKHPLILDDSVYFQKYLTGQGMDEHRDDNKVLKDIDLSKKYKDGEPFRLVKKPEWGIVVYLQETEGGDIYYPNQNITIKPMPGDILIHKAQEECIHGVTPLLSNERIVVPTYIYSEIKVPI